VDEIDVDNVFTTPLPEGTKQSFDISEYFGEKFDRI
jgi:hypothetical protein